jgi:precorrin-6B methylase 1
MDKEKSLEKKIRRQRMVYLAEKVDLEKDPDAKREWEKLRKDLYEGVNPEKRLVEVLYKGDVIFTGNKKTVSEKCKKSKVTVKNLIQSGKPDKQGRIYRWKE